MKTLGTTLPDIYNGLLPESFLNLAPDESIATCSNCVMTQQHKAEYKSSRPKEWDKSISKFKHQFSPFTKCCTYYPFIPNYLVGAILKENPKHPDILELIRECKYILPIGICAPPGYQKKFNLKLATDFGTNTDLLCPFYKVQSGGCSVWKNRGHECSTFFCISSYGEAGELFWSEVRDYLHHVEMVFSQQSMIEKGFAPKEINNNLAYVKRPVDDNLSEWSMNAIEWSKAWIHHLDDVTGYFISCYDFVNDNKSKLMKSIENYERQKKSTDQGFFEYHFVGREIQKTHRNR